MPGPLRQSSDGLPLGKPWHCWGEARNAECRWRDDDVPRSLQRFFEAVTEAKQAQAEAELEDLCEDAGRPDSTTQALGAAGLL